MQLPRRLRHRQPRRGSALIIVLWVIALLSFLIITSLMVAMQDADTVGARRVVFRARQLAEMGVAVAVNPAVKRGDPLLHQKLSRDERFDAVITSEEARLNLNALLTEERRPVLERIFIAWGMTEPESEALVDKMMDWTDEDDFKRLKGAEIAFYREAGFPDRPFNRPFETLDEPAMIPGMEELAGLRPDWRDWFTLRGSGRLDVNEAPAPVLALGLHVPLRLAEALVRGRDGLDGMPGTEDDSPIQSVQDAASLLGLRPEDAELLTVESTTLSIRSIGRAGDQARGIGVVLRKGGGPPTLLEWREFMVE